MKSETRTGETTTQLPTIRPFFTSTAKWFNDRCTEQFVVVFMKDIKIKNATEKQLKKFEAKLQAGKAVCGRCKGKIDPKNGSCDCSN